MIEEQHYHFLMGSNVLWAL